MDFVSARLNMVESQVRTNDVTDVDIADAMRAIPRERLVRADKAHLAYAETPVEYAPGRRLMEPRDVSKLLFALRPRAGERALAIAAPYAAAVLSRMGLRVEALDSLEGDVGVKAALAAEGVGIADGDLLTPPAGPYDVVICEGAVSRLPEEWLAVVAPGGRLGVVERQGPLGRAQVFSKGQDGATARWTAFDATPPYLAGFEPAPAFAF